VLNLTNLTILLSGEKPAQLWDYTPRDMADPLMKSRTQVMDTTYTTMYYQSINSSLIQTRGPLLHNMTVTA